MQTSRALSLVPPAAPTPATLRALAARAAAAVRSGEHAAPRPGSSIRFETAGVDLRVVTWAPGATSQLHDRDADAGAFTVVSGTLTEYVPTGWSDGWMWLRPVEHAADDTLRAGAAFGRHHIHELANDGEEPAVSVHAYAPRLVAPRYYEVVGGELVRSDVLSDPDVAWPMRWAS
jgi:hypothetical protein